MGAASRSFRFKSSVKPLQRNGRRAKLRCKHRRLTALVPRIFRRDYGARGETLPGGFDNVPGGMSYGFVGGLGVRTDADSGLLYMRQRWYDPTLQRFISRDQLHTQNRYDYTAGSPTVFVDVDGMNPVVPGSVAPPPTLRLPSPPTPSPGIIERAAPAVGSSAVKFAGIGAGAIQVLTLLGLEAYREKLRQIDAQTGQQVQDLLLAKAKKRAQQSRIRAATSDSYHKPPWWLQPQKSEQPVSPKPQNDSCGPPDDEDCLESFQFGWDRVQRNLSYSYTVKQNLLEILSKDLKRCNEVGFPNFHNPESGYWPVS